jgi:hypothetical protein
VGLAEAEGPHDRQRPVSEVRVGRDQLGLDSGAQQAAQAKQGLDADTPPPAIKTLKRPFAGTIAEGDQVLASVTFRGRGKHSGITTSWDLWQLWRLRDGKAVRGQAFRSKEEALEAAGLSE